MQSALLGTAMAATLAIAVVPAIHPRPPSSSSITDSAITSTEAALRTCCKICRKGKACGDSCIARDKDCHKPPGCACNESDLASGPSWSE